jgi:hypothetical protein
MVTNARLRADTDDEEKYITQNDAINKAIIHNAMRNSDVIDANTHATTYGAGSVVGSVNNDSSRNAKEHYKDKHATRTDVKHYVYKVLPPIPQLDCKHNETNNTSEAQLNDSTCQGY